MDDGASPVAVSPRRSTAPTHQNSIARKPLPGRSAMPPESDPKSPSTPQQEGLQSPSPDEQQTRLRPSPSSPVKVHEPSFFMPKSATASMDVSRNNTFTYPDGGPAMGEREATVQENSQQTSYTRADPFSNAQSASVSSESFQFGFDRAVAYGNRNTPAIQLDDLERDLPDVEPQAELQYHHHHQAQREAEQEEERQRAMAAQRASHATISTTVSSNSDSHTASSSGEQSHPQSLSRPVSSMGPVPTLHDRGRSLTPNSGIRDNPRASAMYMRNMSHSSERSPSSRNASATDLLRIPHSQQMAHQMLVLDNAKLKGSVGSSAAILDHKKTLDMYRANVKKTNDPAVQYEFAMFMINAAQQASGAGTGDLADPGSQKELLKEARQILQRLADRGYPYAQYFLGDGYFSGFFNNGKEEPGKAFPLFISAGKHGHAEASYRAALCYEFGWGCHKDVVKAVQYHRQAASKGHPGAALRLGKACLKGDMGLAGKYREGITWLKRATENADSQHNSAPYELGLLHVTGHGPDVFKDEAYAAQLFTQAAELGHPEANLRMGEVYERGLLTCPQDPSLSIHFYTSAAQAGLAEGMMGLCAWYMIGADPVLQKDEGEAYEWARKAAQTGLPKAQFAYGYFTEMGIGCNRDPLEANVWYVRAADQGEERAKQRLKIIHDAESAQTGHRPVEALKPGGKKVKKKRSGVDDGAEAAATAGKDEKDCIVM